MDVYDASGTRQVDSRGPYFAWVPAEWTMISGSITTRDVLLNASTIVRSFGLSTFLRCLRALLTGRRTTFLELAWPR